LPIVALDTLLDMLTDISDLLSLRSLSLTKAANNVQEVTTSADASNRFRDFRSRNFVE